MSVRGKIGFHFPGRGNPNLDAQDIKFLPAGISNPTSNDFRQVNKVYAIPAGVTITSVSDLQNYVVWELVEDVLTGDTSTDNFLMVKFKPSTNITVSSIGILTDSNGTGSTSDKFIIVNDSGLLIYSGYGASQESTETGVTKYGYTGYKRTRTFNSSVTLYAGKTYWIHYPFTDCRNHRGAYFNGTSGKYKNFGTADVSELATNTAYPDKSNETFGNMINYTAKDTLTPAVDYAIRTCNVNDIFLASKDGQNAYKYVLNLGTGTYKGIIVASTDDGGLSSHQGSWGISDSDWNNANIAVGDYFIIQDRYYDGRCRVCRCKKTSPDTPSEQYKTYYSQCYDLISADSDNGGASNMADVSNILSLISSRSSFIQLWNSNALATYWNATPESGRTYYLEVNGNEHSSDAERG